MLLRSLSGHEHACRSEHAVTEAVALLEDLGHQSGLHALDRLLCDGLVQLRVERLALRRERLDADALERREQVGLDELDPLGQLRVVLADRLQCAVEVVDRGQQLLCQLGDAAILRERRIARGALAVVLEVGLRALRQRQILIRLLGLRSDLVEVLLDQLTAVVVGTRRSLELGLGRGVRSGRLAGA